MDKSDSSINLPLTFGFIGLLIGLPISYLLQPGIIRTKLSLGEYLTMVPELLSSNFPGKEKIIFPIIFSCIICAGLGVLIGYLIEKSRVSAIKIPDYSRQDNFSKIATSQKIGLNDEILAVINGHEAKIAADPLNTAHILKLADFLIDKTLFDRAIPTLLKLITIENENIAALKLLMDCYEKVERYEDAINTGKKIISVFGSDFEILNKMADLYFKLNNTEKGLKCLTILTNKDPNNLNAWLKKANMYETLGENSESLKAWQSVNRIDPRNTLSNLKIAINMADAGYYGEAISIFNKIIGDFDKQDFNFKILNAYLLWCTIQSDKAAGTKEIKNFSSYVNPNEIVKLSIANQDLLSDILEYYGDIEFASEKYKSAISFYKEANDIKSSQEYKKKIAQAYLNRGISSLSKKNIASAIHYFQEGQIYDPENVQLDNELSSIFSKRKRKIVFRSSFAITIILLLSFTVAFYYYGNESFSITVNPKANITVIREKDLFSYIFKYSSKLEKEIIEDTIILNDAKTLNTGYLFYGNYKIRAEKIGYQKFEATVKTSFGRKKTDINIELKPLLGAIKIDSKPSNARVNLKNIYQEEKCLTPCQIKDIFALRSTIEVAKDGYTPYIDEIEVPYNDYVDLGTISFEGGIKVDSNPSETDVFIDGQLMGKTPLELNHLPAKLSNITLRRIGIGSYVSSIKIYPQKVINLGTLELSKLGCITVKSNPDGALVFLNNKEIGNTPLTSNNVPTGESEIKVSYPGCEPLRKKISLAAGEIIDLGTFSFFGSLKLDSDPKDANVYIDGVYKGKTPIIINDILSKNTNLTLNGPNNEIYQSNILIRNGEINNLGTVKLHTLLRKILKQKSNWRAEIFVHSMEIGNKSGRIDFRNLNCGGDLFYIGTKSNGYLFDENLTYGSCVKGCQIWIKNDGSMYQEICKNKITGSDKLTVIENNLKILSSKNRLLGGWKGRGRQDNGSQWSISINIQENRTYIDYPSLSCGGILKPIFESGDSTKFEEEIIYGRNRCANKGKVELTKISENVANYVWYFPNGKKGASGKIEKVNM